MMMAEWKLVCGFDYNTFAEFLKNKYPLVIGNYYDKTPDGSLKRGKAKAPGYYIHHLREDTVANLCDKEVAAKNLIEYQQAENLVQADILEHFYLHILIAEEFDNHDEMMLGEGGVCWIATTINSKVNKGELSEEEYQVFLQLLNRYCTSSFIRQKYGLQPEDLLKKLLGQCKETKRYHDYLNAVKDTKLFDWNVNAFSEVRNYLRTNRTAAAVICTGGGKTTFALEYLRVYNARGLVLGPSNTIGYSWENNEDQKRFNYDYVNYQTFQNTYTKIDYANYDVIICDEMHHTEAPRWGEGLQYILDNTTCKIIGLTATPTDEQKQGVDKYFGGRLSYGLNLAEGIREGYIHSFSYISALYKLEQEQLSKTEAGRQMLGRLDLELNKNPIDKILRDNMPAGNRKIIVFVQEKEMFSEAKEILAKYNSNFADNEDYSRTIYSGIDKAYIKEAKAWFNKKHDHDIVLFTINMANEGVHFDGVNTLIMFRKTNSATLYLQQLGRIVVTRNKPDPNGIVFDFTNNAQTLIHRPQVVVTKVAEAIEDKTNKDKANDTEAQEDTTISAEADNEVIREIQEAVKEQAEKANSGKVVIYKDYTEDCAATLTALYDVQKRSNADAQIYVQLKNELLSDPDFQELWKELKVESSGRLLISTKTGAHKQGSNRPKTKSKSDAPDDKCDDASFKQVVLASDAERLATVYKLLVRRAYNSGAIDFADDITVGVKVLDKAQLTKICNQLGIRNAELIERAMNNLAKLTFILAVSL